MEESGCSTLKKVFSRLFVDGQLVQQSIQLPSNWWIGGLVVKDSFPSTPTRTRGSNAIQTTDEGRLDLWFIYVHLDATWGISLNMSKSQQTRNPFASPSSGRRNS